MKSKNNSLLFSKAIESRDKGDASSALAILFTIVGVPPDLKVLRVIGDIYWDIGQLHKAISYFRKATQHYPDDELASLALFHTLSNNEQYDEALSEMERFLSIAPSPEYESFRGQYYFEQGMRSEDKRKRIVLLEQAIQVDPEYAEAFMELGKSYKRLGEKEKAEAALRKSIALNDDGWAHIYLGNLFFSLEEWDAAEKEFIIGQERLPDVATPLWCQADVYRQKGDLIKSEHLYRAAVELEPDSADALARLGRFLLENENRSEGEKYIRLALKENPTSNVALKWKQQFSVR